MTLTTLVHCSLSLHNFFSCIELRSWIWYGNPIRMLKLCRVTNNSYNSIWVIPFTNENVESVFEYFSSFVNSISINIKILILERIRSCQFLNLKAFYLFCSLVERRINFYQSFILSSFLSFFFSHFVLLIFFL